MRLAEAEVARGFAHHVQGGEVLEREADRVEHRDLLRIAAARGLAGEHAPELGDREVGGHLLEVALDARLRLVFHEDRARAQHVGVQLGLAGAVAADGVDVHAGLEHVGA